MNNKERSALDRHITGNYGEDQFKGEDDTPVLPSPGPWLVNPDYGKENVYRLWNTDSNYHDDTSPEVMDANARFIESTPDLLDALVIALPYVEDAQRKKMKHNKKGAVAKVLKQIHAAISKAGVRVP